MVAICPKCKKVFGCIDEEEGLIYLCKSCPEKETCTKDRDEFATSIICPDCQDKDSQLEFDFPD